MKKILLCILVIAILVCPLAFVGCSNVPQTQLISNALISTDNTGYELFTYDVYDTSTNEDGVLAGEMTLKWETVKGLRVTVTDLTQADTNERVFDNFNGTKVSMTLSMQNGDTISSIVLFGSDFTPEYSYKITKINAVQKEMQVSYTSKYARTRLFVNGVLDKYECLKIKGTTHFDNEMLYTVMRSSKVDESSYSLSYVCPNALTGELDTMNISKLSNAKLDIDALKAKDIPTPAEGEAPVDTTTECYAFKITTGNSYAGSYSMYIAKNALTVDNDYMNITNVHKAIVKIVEGNYTYIVKDIEIK